MEKLTLLFVLIASVEWAYSAPLDELTDVPLGGDVTSEGQCDSNGPNTDGVLHGMNPLVDETICGVGVGCPECDGPLKSLDEPLGVGHIANSVGLGVECNRGENGCGDGKGERNDHCESCGRNDDHGDNGYKMPTECDNKSDDCGCNENIGGPNNEIGSHNNENCDQKNESGDQDNESVIECGEK